MAAYQVPSSLVDVSVTGAPSPPYIRQHLSYDDCLQDDREDQYSSVLSYVTQFCTIRCSL